MDTNNFTVTQEGNGIWVVAPKKMPSYEEFKEINSVMKSHGGVYTKGARFHFREEPKWMTESNITEFKPKKTEAKPKKVVEKPKPEPKPAEEKPAIEFEVYPPAELDECKKYAKSILAKIDKDDCKEEHEKLLDLLIEACVTDDELRSNFIHTNYEKTFNAAGRKAAMELNKTCISYKRLFPYMVGEYKKVEVKKTTKKPTKEITKETAKKTTKKTKGDK